MILIIDNYDSFTYNLYQYIGEMAPEIEVVRNDVLSVDEIRKMNPSRIIISPGPGYPKDAGVSIEIIRQLGPSIPLLGVCLGHQAIGEAFGGKVVRAKELMHGKASMVSVVAESVLFNGMGNTIEAGRYHSLIVDKASLPPELKITALTEQGEIMAMEHVRHPVYGIQFHPESILTPMGKTILKNFLSKENK
ncbi:MAG: aminodeoxychorismate/anthranilate synthase component II [Fibrobacteres bacterium]|nr:aminodeoxychorismate/anthranilate synthase component II [Fibrobacterota bacterium]